MISYEKCCCSTAYAPCFGTKLIGRAMASSAPPCCGFHSGNDLCSEILQGSIGENPSRLNIKFGANIKYCADNESGAWNVTSKLVGLPRLGRTVFDESGNAQCCSGTNKRMLKRDPTDNAGGVPSCCDSLIDRFKNEEIQTNCCTTNTACRQGIPCCSGGKCLPPVPEHFNPSKVSEGCYISRDVANGESQKSVRPQVQGSTCKS